MSFQEEKNTWIDRHANIYRNLKERKRSLKNFLLFPPTNSNGFSERTSFHASSFRLSRAGIALETLLVLPLFFLGMVTMISFMDIYRLETEHLSSLCEKAKKAGMYAYTSGEKGMEELTLPDIYAYQPIGGLVPLPKVWLFTSVQVHTWVGAGEGNFEGEGQVEQMVYMTGSGSVYHRSLDCTYINLSVNCVSSNQISALRNAYGEEYTACAACSRGQKPAGSVYITEKGSHYHNQETCSGLKRSVRLVKESEAGGHVCSRCG